jgi:hypothetical protein
MRKRSNVVARRHRKPSVPAWGQGYTRRLAGERVEPLSCYQAEVDGLWSVIGRLVDLFAPQECANYFTATSYDAA